MEKTPFAGLTVLEQDESMIEDGGAFQKKDRNIIDYYLQRGAKTHRHTGAVGIGDPVGAPSASVVNSGGTIEPDAAFTIGFSLEDADGGETLLSPTTSVSTPAPLDPPEAAPVPEIDYAAGSLVVGTYYYGITYVDGDGGETPLGPAESVDRQPGYNNGRVLLSGLTVGLATASAAAWRLYRAVGGGDFSYLASGTAATYTDDNSVPVQPDIQPPQDDVNSTNSVNTLLIDLPDDAIIEDATWINVYLSEDGEFSGAVFLEQFPVASAGQRALYRTLELADDQPVDVSTAVGMPAKIDPDTELEDWHWKRPVTTHSGLGSGVLGDVRLVEDEAAIYGMLRSPSGTVGQWTEVASSAGVGGGGASVTLADHGVRSFEDEFNGVTLDPNWAFIVGSNGQCHVANGDLTFDPGGSVFMYRPDYDLEDGVYDFALKLGDSDSAGFSALFKVLNATDFLAVEWDGTSLTLSSWVGLSQTLLHTFGTRSNGNAEDLSIRVIVSGNEITGHLYQGAPEDGKEAYVYGDTYTLTGGDAATFGDGITGAPGLAVYPGTSYTGWKVHYLRVADQAVGGGGSGVVDPASEIGVIGKAPVHVTLVDQGGGEAALIVAGAPRTWGSAKTAGSLASGASANVDLGGVAGMRIVKMSTDRRLRVRFYGESAARAADAGRPIGVTPGPNAGPLLEQIQAAGSARVVPQADAHNTDEPTKDILYLNVHSLDTNSGQAIRIGILYVPTEVA